MKLSVSVIATLCFLVALGVTYTAVSYPAVSNATNQTNSQLAQADTVFPTAVATEIVVPSTPIVTVNQTGVTNEQLDNRILGLLSHTHWLLA